ncbi:MAG TPA: hypothetical protein VFF64_23840 [Candidatus Eremiobacteraceae bacterium]|nr:hypothetical protein [Candidatus Eremiobacteraceae bacterium]
MPRTVKIAPEIDAKLYEELVSLAKQNGQSERFVLSERSSITCTTWSLRSASSGPRDRRSNEKYRELYTRLSVRLES